MTAPRENRRDWDQTELAARRLAGAPEIAPLIRNFATAQIAEFFGALPQIFVGGLDDAGCPCATLLQGPPGFITLPDPRHLTLAAPFAQNETMILRAGAPLALIGIDFSTRRRNRINGRIAAAAPQNLTVAIDEAFGNCPKYIFAQPGGPEPAPAFWDEMAPEAPDMLAAATQAQVFLLATRNADSVDISHRGGPPGFVALGPDGRFMIPDYAGNNYFNSFGNLLADRRAALLFPDFAAGRAWLTQGFAEPVLSQTDRHFYFQPVLTRRLSFAR